MSSNTSSKVVSIAGAMIKLLAIVVGGVVTVICLMSVVGMFLGNGWARLGIAVIVAIGLPAAVADRLLPEDPAHGRGLVSDVFAVAWLGLAFVFVGLGVSVTRPLLHTEARRLAASDMDLLANITFWMAGAPDAPALAGKAPGARLPAPDKASGPDKTAGEHDAGTTDAAGNAGQTGDGGTQAGGDKPEQDGKQGVNGKQGGKDKQGASAPTGKEMSPAELFKQWAPSVVTIAVRKGLLGEGGGTGFLIGSDGTVVTNHHVIDKVDEVRVKLMDSSWAQDVELLFDDEDADIAILRISPAPDVAPVTLGDSDKVVVGERAISIGNPLGLEHTLTDGLISARRTLRGRRMIQMSTPISPGNSGGPLFNLRGEVVGVSTATMSGGFGGGQNLNLAIPINAVKGMLKDDYPGKKRIGGGNPGAGRW